MNVLCKICGFLLFFLVSQGNALAHDDLEKSAFFTICHSLYEKNLPLLVKSSGMKASLPKTVHFIWLSPSYFPPQYVENVRSWIGAHPEWTFKFWTSTLEEPPCLGMQKIAVRPEYFTKLGKCFSEAQSIEEQTKILTLEILSQEGGICVDPSRFCEKSVAHLHDAYDLYLGVEKNWAEFDYGIVAAKKGHRAMLKALDEVAASWDSLRAECRGQDIYTQKLAERKRVTEKIQKAFLENLGKTEVDMALPKTFFSSIPLKLSKEEILERKEQELENRYTSLFWILFSTLILNLIIFGLMIWKRKTRKFL